jgi:hypothetical protein
MLRVSTPIGMRAATEASRHVAARLISPGIWRPSRREFALLLSPTPAVSVPMLLLLPPPLLPAVTAGRAPIPVVHAPARPKGPPPWGRLPLLAPGLLWRRLGRVCVAALREQLIIPVTVRLRRRKELVIAQVVPVCPVLRPMRQIRGREPACARL